MLWDQSGDSPCSSAAEHRLLGDRGEPASLPRAVLRARTLCGAQSHPHAVPGDARATTLPLQQAQTPSTRERDPSTAQLSPHPCQTRGEWGLTAQPSPGALGLVGREVGSCHSLTLPTVGLPAVAAAPCSAERDRANGQKPPLWGNFCWPWSSPWLWALLAGLGGILPTLCPPAARGGSGLMLQLLLLPCITAQVPLHHCPSALLPQPCHCHSG